MNNETFLIEENDLELARDICKYIENPSVRERAVANAVAANIAKKYFSDIEVDTKTGLHNIPQILEEFEISDIYLNDTYVDVRLYFNENELCVPKCHFDKQVLPLAYMFINIDKNLSGGTVTGFISPLSVNTEVCVDGYYPVSESSLESYYDIEPLLVNKPAPELPEDFHYQIFKFLDKKLEDENEFIKLLVNSKEARTQFMKAAEAQNIFNFVSQTKDTIEDIVPEADTLEMADDEDLSLSTEGGELEEFSSIEELEPQELTIDDELNQEDTLDSFDIAEENSMLSEFNEESNLDETIDESEPLQTEDSLDVKESDSSVFANDTNNVEDLDFGKDNDSLMISDEEDEATSDSDLAEFSTEVTPSFDFEDNDTSIEEIAIPENDTEENVEPIVTENETVTEENTADNEAQIDTLFNPDTEQEEIESVNEVQKPKKSKLLPIIGAVAIIAAAGYLGFTKLSQQSTTTLPMPDAPTAKREEVSQKEAMPVESVENAETIAQTNEGTADSIPAIEQNLDASILVSNLSANWEVPAGYVTNNTAKRYFTKLGKVIQLNLKTELLLLSKPPITNRIAVEIEYNKGTQKFNVKGITVSSGEKTVDDIILKTVKNALDMNLNMNISSFGNIQGNPVLIIHF